MGQRAADFAGVAQVPTTVGESVQGLMGVLDMATKGETSGTFLDFEGGVVA
jgi:hypothetical protein